MYRTANEEGERTIKGKRYLYHVTSSENVPGILQYGLKRSANGRKTSAIYLSENPASWAGLGDTVLRVDMDGLYRLALTTTSLPDIDEIFYYGDIPATRITVVSRGTDTANKEEEK